MMRWRVNNMATKGQNKAFDRRRLRKSEKRSDSMRDTMLGNACRRNYRGGRIK